MIIDQSTVWALPKPVGSSKQSRLYFDERSSTLCRKAIIARDWATPNALAIVELLPTEMGDAHPKDA